MSEGTILNMLQELESIIEENSRLKRRVAELESRTLDNRSKLTEREVRDIREAYREGMRQKDLADNYGVNPATISRTVRGIYH
jgi:DNA-binding NarL/FixJ family response regulator